MKKLILPIACTLFASVSANAADININGLQWLKLTDTLGVSRDAVELRLNDSNDSLHGYRYASRDEVAAMLGSYATFDGTNGYYGATAIVNGVARHRDDFGATNAYAGNGTDSLYTTVDGFRVARDGNAQSYGFYGAAGECGSLTQTCLGYNLVYDDVDGAATMAYLSGSYGWDGDAARPLLAGTANAGSKYGSYLVTAVPIPAAAWLFGSGLIGLLGIARRKQSKA